MRSESDYSSALRYFKAALSAVEKAGDTLNQGAILQNIAHIYQVREDVSGFDYALRSYELVAARGGVNARSTAAVVLSSMYVLKGGLCAGPPLCGYIRRPDRRQQLLGCQ